MKPSSRLRVCWLSHILSNAVGELDDSFNAGFLHDGPMYLQIFFEAKPLRCYKKQGIFCNIL
jgi:hypothetical protein